MTALEVTYRYGRTPGMNEMRALDALREVYGIRRVRVDEKENVLRVEYDASRLKESEVAHVLRMANIPVQRRV